MSSDFAPVAASLETALRAHLASLGRAPLDADAAGTVAINSSHVERRARPLLDMLADHGLDSLRGKRLIDIGCGFGALSLFFAAQGARVLGVDPDGWVLAVGSDVAQHHRLAVVLEVGRMERLDVESASQDVAVMNNTLCYIVDPVRRHAALSEARRVLRPGGWLVVRNPNGRHPLDQFTGLPLLPVLSPARAAMLARRAGRRRPVVRLVSPGRALRELRHAGFVDVRHAGRWARSPLARSLARYQHLTARTAIGAEGGAGPAAR